MPPGRPRPDRRRAAPEHHRSRHRRPRRLPLDDGRGAVRRTTPPQRHPGRRQDGHRPGPHQLPVERLVGVRRLQRRPRPGPPVRVVRTSRRPATARQGAAPVVKCMYLALSGITPLDAPPIADPLDITDDGRRPRPAPGRPGLHGDHQRGRRPAGSTDHRGPVAAPPPARLRARQHPLQPRRAQPQHRLDPADRPGPADGHRLLRRVLGDADRSPAIPTSSSPARSSSPSPPPS